MKLIVAMGIEEHTEILRDIFRDHNVVVYSEAPIQGFRPHIQPPDAGNWFASHADGVFSRVVFAFVPDGTSKIIIEAIRAWNGKNDPHSPMHAFELNVEGHS